MVKLLEMFKGTGSVGKVAKKMGWQVTSLDFDPIYTPDIETDILFWNYKDYHKKNNYVPDFIWASPPCNTFSTLAYQLKERNTKTGEPYSERAKTGTKILHRTLEIIQYFKRLNPNLKYVIENPRAMMRLDKKLQKEVPNRDTTLYCHYGYKWRKPTDFFNNVPGGLQLAPSEVNCSGDLINVAKVPLDKRYSIPPKLVKHMLERMMDTKTMKGGVFTEAEYMALYNKHFTPQGEEKKHNSLEEFKKELSERFVKEKSEGDPDISQNWMRLQKILRENKNQNNNYLLSADIMEILF